MTCRYLTGRRIPFARASYVICLAHEPHIGRASRVTTTSARCPIPSPSSVANTRSIGSRVVRIPTNESSATPAALPSAVLAAGRAARQSSHRRPESLIRILPGVLADALLSWHRAPLLGVAGVRASTAAVDLRVAFPRFRHGGSARSELTEVQAVCVARDIHASRGVDLVVAVSLRFGVDVVDVHGRSPRLTNRQLSFGLRMMGCIRITARECPETPLSAILTGSYDPQRIGQ